MKTFADSSKIVVVSPASISSNLALSGDCVFRLIMPSKIIAWTLARAVVDKGYTKAAVIYPSDAWGTDLYNAFKERFEKPGGVVKGITYDPKAEDLSAEVGKLADLVQEMDDGTAVVTITFEKKVFKSLNLPQKHCTFERAMVWLKRNRRLR